MVREIFEFPWEGQFPSQVTAAMMRDIYRNNEQTLGRTHRFFEVRNPSGDIILAAGVAIWTFSRPPELWMMMAKPFLKSLKSSLELTREGLRLPLSIYGYLTAETETERDARFMRAVGMRETGAPSLRPNGERFTQFEVLA